MEDISEEIVLENFIKLMSDTKPQIQEDQRASERINARNTTQTFHSQPAEGQRQSLERNLTYRGAKIRILLLYFSC